MKKPAVREISKEEIQKWTPEEKAKALKEWGDDFFRYALLSVGFPNVNWEEHIKIVIGGDGVHMGFQALTPLGGVIAQAIYDDMEKHGFGEGSFMSEVV